MTQESFDSAFIEQQRSALLQLREQLQDTLRSLKNEVSSLESSHSSGGLNEADNAVNAPQAEVGEQKLSLEILRLSNIDRALKKIDEGTYGYCESSGKPIAKARLEAQPAALHSIEEAQRLEKEAQAPGA